MDVKAFEAGTTDQKKLVKNSIDIDFLSHIILFPQAFTFESVLLIDLLKLSTNDKLRLNQVGDFKNKRCKVILGFETHKEFNESDIALETNLYDALRMVHCCQLLNLEEFYEFNKDNFVIEEHPVPDPELGFPDIVDQPISHSTRQVLRSSTNRVNAVNFFKVFGV
jgi:hypothetical protein